MKALKGAVGFFTQIPTGRDLESFESLRKNLWILPIVGLISGIFVAIPSYFLSELNAGFAAVVFYIFIEGINHIDGLADFGDSVFAKDKFKALKDTKIGSGGAVFIVFYLIVLSFSFQNLESEIIYAVVLSQICAKTAMLVLLTTSRPLWDGLAKTMMEFASKKDLVVGTSTSISIFIFTSVLTKNLTILCILLFSFLLTALYRFYVFKKFGGVNGDIIGALNCIVFASTMVMFVILRHNQL